MWLLFEFNAQAAIVAPAQAPTVDIPNFRNLEAIFVSTCYWLELTVKKSCRDKFFGFRLLKGTKSVLIYISSFFCYIKLLKKF